MIEQTVIEGIPTLVAPASGPLRGGISFRVGHADETLARSGITHLIEHLALFRHGMADYHYNGATAPTVTHFYSQGSPEDVGAYLNDVCRTLADLPFDRFETEKEILRTEANSRSRSVLEPMSLWRYGAQGHGLAAYPEWGLYALTPDDLRAWVARYFTRDNAVLWFSGPPPANLRPVLAAGQRMPLPPVTNALATTPAFFCGPEKTLGLHSVVDRGAAAQVFVGILERELFRSLRQEGGYSYTVATDYSPTDAKTAVIAALADTNPDKQDAAIGAFVDVLAKLRVGNIDQDDIDATLSKAAESLQHPEFDAARLPGAAVDVLIGKPVLSSTQIEAQLAAVTIADVHRVARTAHENALLMTPTPVDWAGYEAAPSSSAAPTRDATRYPMINNSASSLLLGPDGVSFEEDGRLATVAFAQCAAMLAWPDGGRLLVGTDGVSCRVEPTLFGLPSESLAGLDARVPAESLVRMPARPADAIPKPPAKDAAAERAVPDSEPTGPTSTLGKVLTVVLRIVFLFLLMACTLTVVFRILD